MTTSTDSRPNRLLRNLLAAFCAVLLGVSAVGVSVATAPEAHAATLICSAAAAGTGNTAEAWLTRGTPPTCHPGVRGRWRPPGAPLNPPFFETAIQWARWSRNRVSLNTQPSRVGQTAHVTGMV